MVHLGRSHYGGNNMIDNIMSSISEAYLDLSWPDLSFALRRFDSPEFKKLILELKSHGYCFDSETLNSDNVSVTFYPCAATIRSHLISISLVGNYYIIINPERKIVCLYELEDIGTILNKHGFICLNEALLSHKLKINLSYLEDEIEEFSIIEVIFGPDFWSLITPPQLT